MSDQQLFWVQFVYGDGETSEYSDVARFQPLPEINAYWLEYVDGGRAAVLLSGVRQVNFEPQDDE